MGWKIYPAAKRKFYLNNKLLDKGNYELYTNEFCRNINISAASPSKKRR